MLSCRLLLFPRPQPNLACGRSFGSWNYWCKRGHPHHRVCAIWWMETIWVGPWRLQVWDRGVSWNQIHLHWWTFLIVKFSNAALCGSSYCLDSSSIGQIYIKSYVGYSSLQAFRMGLYTGVGGGKLKHGMVLTWNQFSLKRKTIAPAGEVCLFECLSSTLACVTTFLSSTYWSAT